MLEKWCPVFVLGHDRLTGHSQKCCEGGNGFLLQLLLADLKRCDVVEVCLGQLQRAVLDGQVRRHLRAEHVFFDLRAGAEGFVFWFVCHCVAFYRWEQVGLPVEMPGDVWVCDLEVSVQ